MKKMIEAHGVVLAKSPSGENFLKLHLLGEETGGIYALIRRPSTRRPGGAQPQPDLFDRATLQLESPAHNEGVYFVRGYELERRHSAIAADYRRLVDASRFVRILAANINQMLHSDALFQLTCRTLHLFESPARSELVLFKALFLLFRTEGYPVNERWLPALNLPDRALTEGLLALTLEPPEACAAPTEAVERITSRLLVWATRETDFTVP